MTVREFSNTGHTLSPRENALAGAFAMEGHSMDDALRMAAGTDQIIALRIKALPPPWPKNHIGCNVTTCPNGKCNATGECQDAPVAKRRDELERARQSRDHGG